MKNMTSSPRANSALPAFLALGCVGLFTTPALAADEAPDPQATIVVTGQQAHELNSEKSVAPLLDTPQTVTVISDQVLRKQNLLTLRDALATVPGITFGAGEGGGGYGDSINLRGYSANNDITIDGVRDSAQYSRTDPFNLQLIEVYNGANSVYSGSGSVGGTINLASKVPQAENLTILQGSVGTDDYYRSAVDSNWRLSPLVAVRLNAMVHRNDVPGRDVEKFKRWGIAPSITIGMEGPTSLTISYVHQKDDNTPIYGVPFFRNQINNGPLPGVDDSDYFGIANLDTQETTIDRLSAKFRHDFGNGLIITNMTRWQRVGQYSQTSAPQGTFCLANGLQPVPTSATSTTGQVCTGSIANVNVGGVFGTYNFTVPAGFFQPNGPRGLVRDQENQLLYNQTDLRWEAGEKGGLHNTLVIGGAYTVEDYKITTASLIRNTGGDALVLPQFGIVSPNTIYTGPINYTVTGKSNSETTNAAIYAFDNLEIGPMFELNAGIRYEHNRNTFQAVALPFYPRGTTPLTALQLAPQISSEKLFSYRVGAVFKPRPNISLYAAYANSQTPSSATVRAGCGAVVASPAGAFDPCAVAPEKARSIEIGAKVDLFDRRLQLTAAAFRNERTNFRVPSNDAALPSGLQVLDGRSRVDGIALGAAGNVTPEWTLFANYTYLDGSVVQSVSNDCLARPDGTFTPARPALCNNSASIPDPQAGDQLVQTPKHSGSLFTTYTLPFGLQVGYGFTYQGAFALHQRTLAMRNQYKSDSYITQRLFLSYEVQKGLTAQLNVQNLFNEKYYTAIRNNVTAATGVIGGGWATPGEARSAVFSLFYSF
ncbi:MAG: TonB-dependent receptor [Sphingomonadales bacterium]